MAPSSDVIDITYTPDTNTELKSKFLSVVIPSKL